jgi:RimJ/RimL family protein N-acetyltransferase
MYISKFNHEDITIAPTHTKYATDFYTYFIPEIADMMAPDVFTSIKQTESILAQQIEINISQKEAYFVVLSKDTQEFLGATSIHNIESKKPELSIWIKKGAWGHAYGRKAIYAIVEWIQKHLYYDYIIYDAVKYNYASRNIAESLGGTIINSYNETCNGIIYPIVVYKIT